MDNSGTQIIQEVGSSRFMEKNESNLTIYEQLRIAAWWQGRRLENGSEGLGAQLWEAEVPVESIGSLSLSTQTAGFVGSFLCPGQTEQVVFSEGAGLIRHRREGPAHKS